MISSSISSSNPAILVTEGLTKVYNRREVVNHINLTLLPKEIYGFLGPNGAGKSTTLRMILGLIKPTAGDIWILGQSVKSSDRTLRSCIGVVGEQDRFFENMTALQYLNFFAAYYLVEAAKQKINHLLEIFELLPFVNFLATEYSHGMKRKLSLARALLHQPSILILDEPTSGLDPFGIRQVRFVLEEQRRLGCSILISSHILSEVERIADRVGIINRGELLLESTVDAVKSRLAPETVLEITLQAPVHGLNEILMTTPNVSQVSIVMNIVTITLNTSQDLRALISQVVTTNGGVIVGMRLVQADLEDAFIRITDEWADSLQGKENQP